MDDQMTNNPFQDPDKMKQLEKTFKKSGVKSKTLSREENDKTEKSSWGNRTR